MPEHRKTLRHLLCLGQREAVPRITPGVSAELKPLDHVRRRTQQLTSRSLNARDEFILSRAFSLGHHRNFWISAFPDFHADVPATTILASCQGAAVSSPPYLIRKARFCAPQIMLGFEYT